MHVILDANVYIEDLKLRKNRFANLFDFLRRTDSTLVIPELVLEEVLARHKDSLETKLKRVVTAGDDLSRFLVTGESQFRKTFEASRVKVDLGAQGAALKDKLLKPAAGVHTLLATDFSNVRIADVYRRGLYRTRPSNQQGEELRDVILWLFVLSYAETIRGKVGFVSRDGGFWEGSELHAEIKRDIHTRGVEVAVYNNLDEFNKANALRSTPLNSESAEKLIPIRHLDDKFIAKAAALLSRVEGEDWVITFRSGSVATAKFQDGMQYEIGPRHAFAEVPYQADLQLTFLSSPRQRFTWWQAALRARGGVTSRTVPLSSLLAPIPGMLQSKPFEFELRPSVYGQISMRITDSTVQSAEVDTLFFPEKT